MSRPKHFNSTDIGKRMTAFTENLPLDIISPDVLSEKAQEASEKWEKKGKSPLLAMAEIISRFISSDENNYLRLGFYWWAVKDVLYRLDLIQENNKEEGVRGVYSGGNDIETLLLAYEFKAMYDKTYLKGNAEFPLGGGLIYVLFDEDFGLKTL